MQANQTVTINGRLYDAVTGLPVKKEALKTAKEAVDKPTDKPISPAAVKKHVAQVAASSVHAQPQKSKTLYRRIARKSPGEKASETTNQKPATAAVAATKPASVGMHTRPQPGRRMDFARGGNGSSSRITKFAPHPVATAIKKANETPDIAPKAHPVAARALARTAKPLAAFKTSKQIKDQAIARALASPIEKSAKVKKEHRFHWSRRFTIITAIFAVLIIGAYLTYVNIPSISVGFAASQAGISATYPQYKPDGFHLAQPVTYSSGTVTLNFKSNSNDTQYSVVQAQSSWDSSAVLANIVEKAAGQNYITTQESGLTIYQYNNTAVWVNGGILYTISGNALLSDDQIRQIATSM
jgi:hypothetical protein